MRHQRNFHSRLQSELCGEELVERREEAREGLVIALRYEDRELCRATVTEVRQGGMAWVYLMDIGHRWAG